MQGVLKIKITLFCVLENKIVSCKLICKYFVVFLLCSGNKMGRSSVLGILKIFCSLFGKYPIISLTIWSEGHFHWYPLYILCFSKIALLLFRRLREYRAWTTGFISKVPCTGQLETSFLNLKNIFNIFKLVIEYCLNLKSIYFFLFRSPSIVK